MRAPLLTYCAALVSSGAVFRFGYSIPVLLASVYAAASALIGMCLLVMSIVAWRRSAPARSSWHMRRAAALSERQEGLSWLIPLSAFVWLGLHAAIEWGHVLRAESIGGGL